MSECPTWSFQFAKRSRAATTFLPITVRDLPGLNSMASPACATGCRRTAIRPVFSGHTAERFVRHAYARRAYGEVSAQRELLAGLPDRSGDDDGPGLEPRQPRPLPHCGRSVGGQQPASPHHRQGTACTRASFAPIRAAGPVDIRTAAAPSGKAPRQPPVRLSFRQVPAPPVGTAPIWLHASA